MAGKRKKRAIDPPDGGGAGRTENRGGEGVSAAFGLRALDSFHRGKSREQLTLGPLVSLLCFSHQFEPGRATGYPQNKCCSPGAALLIARRQSRGPRSTSGLPFSGASWALWGGGEACSTAEAG